MRALLMAAALSLCVGVATAQEGTIPQVGPPRDILSNLRPDVEIRKTCWINEVATYENRIHIHCTRIRRSGGSGGLYTAPDRSPNAQLAESISYFAVSVQADPGLTTRVLTLATDSAAAGREVSVLFLSDAAQNPPGCLPSDCRRLIGLTIFPN